MHPDPAKFAEQSDPLRNRHFRRRWSEPDGYRDERTPTERWLAAAALDCRTILQDDEAPR